MSDVSEPVVDAPVETDVSVDDIDFDAVPDEWRDKVRKLSSENKNLRDRFTPYRDTFDGLDDTTREGFLNVVNAYKSGDFENLARWMVGSAQGLAGDKFDSILSELTPKQQAQLEQAIEDVQDESSEPEYFGEEDIARIVEERIAAKEAERQQNSKLEEQIRKINSELDELGYKEGLERKFVVQIAKEETNGDLKAAHEKYQTLLADQAVRFLQSKSGQGSVVPENGAPNATPNSEFKDMTPAERIRARIAAQKEAGA